MAARSTGFQPVTLLRRKRAKQKIPGISKADSLLFVGAPKSSRTICPSSSSHFASLAINRVR